MTKKESTSRNIGLTFDFLRQVVKEPALLEKLSDGTTLEFIEKDFVKSEKKTIVKAPTNKTYLRVQSRLDVI